MGDQSPIGEAIEVTVLLVTIAKVQPVTVRFNHQRGMWECEIGKYMGVGVSLRDAVYHAWRVFTGG